MPVTTPINSIENEQMEEPNIWPLSLLISAIILMLMMIFGTEAVDCGKQDQVKNRPECANAFPALSKK